MNDGIVQFFDDVFCLSGRDAGLVFGIVPVVGAVVFRLPRRRAPRLNTILAVGNRNGCSTERRGKGGDNELAVDGGGGGVAKARGSVDVLGRSGESGSGEDGRRQEAGAGGKGAWEVHFASEVRW